MAWYGAYGLDLYCDGAIGPQVHHGAPGELADSLGHRWGEFPHQYTAETGAECRRQARVAGWILRKDGRAFCPRCARGLR